MSKGWVKLHRSMMDNDFWLAEPFTKAQAWIDLFANANHSPATFWVRDIEVNVDRGQLAWSELTMEKRWKWSRGKVRRYLGMLKSRGMIVQQTNNVTSILTICNYGSFQDGSTSGDTPHGTADRTPSGTPDEHQTVHKQEEQELENGKNVKKSMSPQADDADVIFEYWRQRMGKNGSAKFSAKRRKAVNDRIKDGRTIEQIKQAIDGCAKTDFNMGRGPKSDGTVYDDLELICRNNEKFEHYLGLNQRMDSPKEQKSFQQMANEDPFNDRFERSNQSHDLAIESDVPRMASGNQVGH